MLPNKVMQLDQLGIHNTTIVPESFTLTACSKLNYDVETEFEVRDLHMEVTLTEKLLLSSAACVTYLFSMLLFIQHNMFVYREKRERGIFGCLVLVYDNNVLYLLGYAPVSCFGDPSPSPSSK